MPRLFTYGTLRQADVQLALFDRLLSGRPDALAGYRIERITITNDEVTAMSGSSDHPILVASGDPGDRIEGTVFELSDAELAAADRYETNAYARILVSLESGVEAFVYARAGAGGS